MSLSIRWRLTLWNTLALAALLLGFAGLVYALVIHALYEQADKVLLGGFHELEHDDHLDGAPGEFDRRLGYLTHELQEHNNLLCIVYGSSGKVLAATKGLETNGVPMDSEVGNGEPRLRDLTIPGLGRQRVLEGRLRWEGQDHRVVIMASLEEVDNEMRSLLIALLTAVPIAVAVSAGVAYLLARKALAPVEQLRRSTQEITADHLSRRLPVANPGDELGRLAQTINEMIGRLERSFAEVRRFTADASHELRTPLTAIRTEAEVALTRAAPTADQQQLLGSILEECERLTRLTDQLLTLSREDAGVAHFVREPVDLQALVRGVAETMRPLADARGLRLNVECGEGVEVCGDGARLRQVFFNLLDNAIKYTPTGGEIGVRTERRGRNVIVTVRDTGIGIPAEHLPRVFDRFYRVDKARSREQGGTGLGLSISQGIVAAHGGGISVESAVGKGATFTVILPPGSKP
jgi:heavy metal sensor kinase